MLPNQKALYPEWLIVYILRVIVPMLILSHCSSEDSIEKWQGNSMGIQYQSCKITQ